MRSAPRSDAVALVHDYLTQRGGAERVVLEMAEAFPGAPIHTSLYEPSTTFPEFSSLDVRPSALNALPILRRQHRTTLPLLAPLFSAMRLDADVVICSSSGWAHGVRTEGRKIVYCHTPARWLYQTGRYFGARFRWARGPFQVVALPLRVWDRSAARSAHRYLVNSTAVQRRVAELYGLESEVLPPPPGLRAEGPQTPVLQLQPGFALSVCRLLSYKNVHALVEAFRALPEEKLVIAGSGPLLGELRRMAPKNVELLGRVDEPTLRWLYQASSMLVAPAFEDFGLTPIEAGLHGKPTAALRFGGYLDTVVPGVTGLYFDEPTPERIARATHEVLASKWRRDAILAHAARFSADRFHRTLQAIVAEEHCSARSRTGETQLIG